MILSLQFSPPAVVSHKIARLLRTLESRLALTRPTADDVHKIRVCCKKLRSWIRLLRHRRSAQDWQHADRALRKIVRQFALARDTLVLRQTIAKLQAATRSARNRSACRQVLAGLQTHTPVARATKIAPLSQRVVNTLGVNDKLTHKTLNKGLQHAYARCRQRARRAFADAGAIEPLHELRRWVKYLAYQLELVDLPTPASKKFTSQLVSLGKILGQVHDLAELQHRLTTIAIRNQAAVDLVATQARRLQQRLIRQAEVLARALFGF